MPCVALYRMVAAVCCLEPDFRSMSERGCFAERRWHINTAVLGEARPGMQEMAAARNTSFMNCQI